MRIVAGSHGGRRLKAPPGRRVRPTPDKVREALFGIIGARVAGTCFLDLYAGTGAVGLEALSRGARTVHFAEQSAVVRRVLRENIARLGCEDATLVWSGRLPGLLDKVVQSPVRFDYVFADPPYERGQVERLLAHPSLPLLVTPGASLIVEMRHSEQPESGVWEPTDRRRYGDTVLWFLTLPEQEA